MRGADLTPARLALIVVMFAGPLLQGLAGIAQPNAYVFAPVISLALLPLGAGRGMRDALLMAGMFLAIGLICLGLWWLGGLAGPVASIPRWLPLAVTIAGAVVPILARRGRP